MARLPVLSQNGEKILRQILKRPESWVTSSTLAEAIGISKRTVMRELASVEKWVLAAGAGLVKSPGKGIKLTADKGERDKLLTLLGNHGQDKIPDKDRRIRQIFTILILSEEPVKQYFLASEVGISERTLSGDLDHLQEWLEKQGLKLLRKSGVGVWIQGEDTCKRRATNLMLVNQYPDELYDMMFHEPEEKRFDISSLLDQDILRKVKNILHIFEIDEDLRFADSGFITLAIHLTLLLKNLTQKEHQLPKEEHAFSCDQILSPVALRLGDILEEAFAVILPADQLVYLSRYLNAYRGNMSDESMQSNDMDARYLSSVLIKYMELELDVDLSPYPTLADDLSNHIRAMLHRMKYGIYTDNPHLAMFREQYSWLWGAVRNACDAVYEIQAYPDLLPIPDEEAGYLGMHFGAVLEQDDVVKMRIQTVIVCPLGLASSRFLTSQILKDYPVLHVQRTCSVRDITDEYLQRNEIDLLISTVPLQLEFPYIMVNTILQPADHTLLKEAVSRCQIQIQDKIRERKKKAPSCICKEDSVSWKSRSSSVESATRYANRVSEVILDFLKHIVIEESHVPGKRSRLIEDASYMFAETLEDAKAIEYALLEREAIADTYIRPLRCLLLHCKTDMIEGSRFGFLKADPPVYEPGQMIQGALVLLASNEESQVPVEVIQAVSGMLIDKPELMEALHADLIKDAVHIIEEGLEQRFRSSMKKVLK